MNANLRRLLLPAILVVTLGIVYSLTLAPDITWANRGADGGDLITAAATGGVAHPPGYPTYLALARLFQYLPVGTLAFRTNLLSMVCGLLAAVVVADLAKRSFPGRDGHEQYAHFAGFIAGLAFGLSPLFWSQAVITEVYTLHALFVALILWLTPLSGEHAPKWRLWMDRLGGLLFGLALGNQLTVIFLLPVWLLVGMLRTDNGETKQEKVSLRTKRSGVRQSSHHFRNFLIHIRSFAMNSVNWRSLARRASWLLLGLTIYITIPLRARSGSPVNWGYAVDWDGFWWLVSGKLYQDRIFNLPIEYLWPRIRNWAGWLQTQFGLFGLILGFYGLLYGKPRSRRFLWITGWMFLAYSAFSIGYNSTDSYALLIPAFMAFALWLGLGVARLFETGQETQRGGKWFPLLVGILALLMVFVNTAMVYPDVDASQDWRAVDFGQAVMEIAPQDAIILSVDDEDVFALRYYTYALGQRPDIAVLSGALRFEWYREIMRETYPSLLVPDDDCYPCLRSTLILINARPVCESQLDSPEVLRCGLTE